MPTSADLRARSRVAIETARALGSNDRLRNRNLAAYGLALALEAEQLERKAGDDCLAQPVPQAAALGPAVLLFAKQTPLRSTVRLDRA